MDKQGEFFWMGNHGKSLAEARREFFDHIDEGCYCQCCDRWGQRYKRTMYASQAKELIRLYWLCRKADFDGRYFDRHIVTPYCNNGDLILTKRWELIEAEPNKDPKKKDSGKYRIRKKGSLFVLRKIMIPKAIFMYNDTVEAFSTELTDIVGVLGTEFDYNELMGGGWERPEAWK